MNKEEELIPAQIIRFKNLRNKEEYSNSTMAQVVITLMGRIDIDYPREGVWRAYKVAYLNKYPMAAQLNLDTSVFNYPSRGVGKVTSAFISTYQKSPKSTTHISNDPLFGFVLSRSPIIIVEMKDGSLRFVDIMLTPAFRTKRFIRRMEAERVPLVCTLTQLGPLGPGTITIIILLAAFLIALYGFINFILMVFFLALAMTFGGVLGSFYGRFIVWRFRRR